MDAERWLAVLLVVGIVILAAVVLDVNASSDFRDLEYEIRDLRRDVGEVRREIEWRAEQDDRDVERLLSELRRRR